MRPNYLSIFEVSQKQAYIFGSRKLRDNLTRSEEIRYVTTPEFFAECCGDDFSAKDNLVYNGGGHAVLQFQDREQALRTANAITSAVLTRFPGMEMYTKLMEYRPEQSPGDNLNALSVALEEKKALRLASFHRYSFGVDVSREPVQKPLPVPMDNQEYYREWKLTADGEQLAGEDNFLAIVHIDGNAMGARVQRIYEKAGNDWEKCRSLLDQFSREIDEHFSNAFDEMRDELVQKLPSLGWNAAKDSFPLRRIINAGDDVCFVCAGKLGLSCAASFLRHLSGKINHADDKGYSACAGVCMVHKKYPFRAAYDMSEQLCSNAKRFGTKYDPNGGISCMDWHIEFGQLKDSLREIRSDYLTEDGGRLELRPYSVVGGQIPQHRQFAFFCSVIRELGEQAKNLPRSKVKSLREALKQGELETVLALKSMNLENISDLGVETRVPDWLKKTLKDGKVEKGAFISDGETRRSLYFDAIELMDHVAIWEEEAK